MAVERFIRPAARIRSSAKSIGNATGPTTGGCGSFSGFSGVTIESPEDVFLLRPFLRDPRDDFVIELAVASRADYIVTWNIGDFTEAVEYGMKVVRPNEFLNLVKTWRDQY